MNKVIFIAGVLTIFVVGGLFFCAGLFTGANVAPEKMSSTISKITQGAEKATQSIGQKISNLTKEDSDGITDTQIIVGANDKNDAKDEKESSIILEKPSTEVNVDKLLNEIASKHETNDSCLTENVKSEKQELIVNNEENKHVVFVGYFAKDISSEVAKLLMVKGYPAHVQPSSISNGESFVFCGPFKKESSAHALLEWLKSHDFKNAKIVTPGFLASENIDNTKLQETNDTIPNNMDVRKTATQLKRNKKPIKSGNEQKVEEKIEVVSGTNENNLEQTDVQQETAAKERPAEPTVESNNKIDAGNDTAIKYNNK